MNKLNKIIKELPENEADLLLCELSVGSVECGKDSIIEILRYENEILFLNHNDSHCWDYDVFMTLKELYAYYDWDFYELLAQLDEYVLTGPKTHENVAIATIIRLLAKCTDTIENLWLK